jgi:CarD family transcriptional regulator
MGPRTRAFNVRPGDRRSARAIPKNSSKSVEFKLGEFAVYPGYGVGQILAIETKEILGSKCEFYVVHIIESGMKVMVPKNNASSVGLRPIISKSDANRVLEILRETNVPLDNQTWNRRYREYMDKIRTGF